MNSQEHIEEGVYRIPLILSHSLEPQREELEGLLVSAQRRLMKFAGQNGWADLMADSFADRAEIYDDKAEYDRVMLKLCGMDPGTKVPATYSAALEQGILIAVSRELFARNFPEGVEKDSYEKLFCHEMAHRLHIRILKGDEDAMGPVWFYEGFALYAAGQFEDDSITLSEEEISSIINDPNRGSYRKYAAVFRHFLKLHRIQELVSKSGLVW